MPSHFYRALVAVASGAILIAGCSRFAPHKKTGTAPADASDLTEAAAADYSAAAIQARIEAHTHFAAAVIHEQHNEHEPAAEQYYMAALANPADENLALEATTRLLRFRPTDKPDDKSAAMRAKALEILKKASSYPTATGAVFARLGLVYSLAGEKDLAVKANQEAIERSPTLLPAYQYLAQIYLQNNQPAEGLKILAAAGSQPNPDAKFLLELGETYIAFARSGTADEAGPKAFAALERAAALSPTSPAILQRLADGFDALGKPERAAQFYLQVLERLPSLTGLRDKLVELYLRLEDRTNAATQLRAVIRESPTNPRTQYLLGSILFEDKKLEEAGECFKTTILLRPDFEPAYYDLAATQINTGAPSEALNYLREARKRFDQSFVGEFYTALAYSRMKDYKNSLKHLTSAEIIARATATNRLTHDFYFQIGSTYERNKQFKDAEKYFRKALKLKPDFSEALNYLGYMWAERGENLVEAHKMIEKAVELDPENAAFLDSLGWVLFKLDKPREALTWLQKAVANTTEPDPTLYDHLGDIYHALGDTAKAREAWQKSLAVEPAEEIERKLKNNTPTTTPKDTASPNSR